MRVLFSAAPGVGHLLPLLPLAREAAGRDHDVRIAVGGDLAPIVERAGFEHVSVGPALADIRRGIPGLAEATGRQRAVLMVRHAFGGAIARGMADDLLAYTDASTWRPDLIVHEDMEVGSWVLAERLGIPLVTVQATAWRPRVRELLAASITPLCGTYGLTPDAVDRLAGRLFFTTRPSSMLDPAEPLPSGAAELRPIADDRDAGPLEGTDATPADPVDAVEAVDGGDVLPRVAVTFGTVNADLHGPLHAIVDGAAAAGSSVIVALGGDPAAFGPVPASVTVNRYVPMSMLLPSIDVLVFHGGSGTLTAALAAGRPMVIVPIAADQLDNADRAEAAGVARTILLNELTAARVQAAIESVLADDTMRRRATEIAAEVAAMPGPDRALDRIEAIASNG